eukprot:4016575-Pyramimonas_sp.AAC.1
MSSCSLAPMPGASSGDARRAAAGSHLVDSPSFETQMAAGSTPIATAGPCQALKIKDGPFLRRFLRLPSR